MLIKPVSKHTSQRKADNLTRFNPIIVMLSCTKRENYFYLSSEYLYIIKHVDFTSIYIELHPYQIVLFYFKINQINTDWLSIMKICTFGDNQSIVVPSLVW